MEAGAQKGTAGGGLPAVPKNEPIFKKLTDEIKGLQTSQGIYEQYINTVTNCYQSVILDLGSELTTLERQQEQRLLLLEEQMRRIEKDEETSQPLTVKDLILCAKGFWMMIISFFKRTTPILCSWCTYISAWVAIILEKILADERVQHLLSSISRFQRDAVVLISGAILCHLYSTITKRQKEKVQPSQNQIVPFRETSTNARRRRRKLKGGQITAETAKVLQAAPSLRTDEEDSSY